MCRRCLTDIAHVAATQATVDDIKSTKDLFTHVIAAIDVDIAARAAVISDPEIKKGSRKKKPVPAVVASVVVRRASSRGTKRKQSSRKAANSSDDKEEEEEDIDDVRKPSPKKKGSGKGSRPKKNKTSKKKVSPKVSDSDLYLPTYQLSNPIQLILILRNHHASIS